MPQRNECVKTQGGVLRTRMAIKSIRPSIGESGYM